MAALLGVGIAETLNKVVVRMSRASQLVLVLIGLAAGAVLGLGMRFVVQGQWGMALMSVIPASISILVIILAILFRFRT